MSENITKRNVRDEEIDLLDLFGRMGTTMNRWKKSLGRAFLITIVFLLKRWLPLGLSLATGVGVAYLVKIKSESVFTSEMTLRSNSSTPSEMIAYINRLHIYCMEKNTGALADAISLTSQQIKNIIDINSFWIIDKGLDGNPDFVDYKNEHDIYDTLDVRMIDRFDVRVRIKRPQELTIVRNGIIAFINSDSLFQQRNKLRIIQNQDLIARLNYDILQLDSLQKIKYFVETKNKQPQNGGQMIFLQEQKTQLVYADIYSLYSRRQVLESDRVLYPEPVTVLIDFSLPAVRDNGFLFYGKIIIPIFFCVTLLVLIILANRKSLAEVYKKY